MTDLAPTTYPEEWQVEGSDFAPNLTVRTWRIDAYSISTAALIRTVALVFNKHTADHICFIHNQSVKHD